MRVVYQGEVYSRQRHGGITRYFDKLISHLPASVTPMLTTRRERSDHTDINNPNLKVFGLRPFRPQRVHGWAEKAHVMAVTRLFRADLFHPTFYSFLAGTGNWPRCPVVLTVHDMIDELLPHMTGGHWMTAAKEVVIPRADAIICVSENTRKDLLALFPGVSADRICVIPLATDLELPQDARSPVPQERPYFIFVGSRTGYKNFSRLLEAFALLVKRYREVQLRVIGSGFTPDELAKITTLGIAGNVINVGQVSDAELASAYCNSVALVYPSLYEGFGIPLLEAMACHTAVLASNTSSLPEVAGSAALYFDPHSVEDIAEKLVRILDDAPLRTRLVQAGSERILAFSWSRTAEQTMRVYERVQG
jgi:glycosyltransferase involved in cell wall biosynthesis